MDQFSLERKVDKLQRTVETANKREGSWVFAIWKGILIGIGSTIGVALILYVLVILTRALGFLPIIGGFFQDIITPTLEQVIETRVPNPNDLLPYGQTDTPEQQETNTDNQIAPAPDNTNQDTAETSTSLPSDQNDQESPPNPPKQ